MMDFRVKKIGLEGSFDYLKKLREKKEKTLEEISRELKIPFNFLEFFEKREWSKLPPDVYAKKYLLAYLNFLGEEATGLRGQLLDEWGKARNAPNSQPPDKLRVTQIKNENSITISQLFGKIGIFIFVFIIFGYLSWQFYIFFRSPTLVIWSPPDDLIIHTPLIAVEGQTEKETPLFINGVEIPITSDGTFKEEVGLQKGVNIIKIEAEKKYGGKSTIFKKVLFE